MIDTRLLALLNAELEYLGIAHRVMVVEEREVKNRNEWVRSVVDSYADRALNGASIYAVETDETEHLDFYLDRHSRGLWEACIRHGVASNRNELANQALAQYFKNRERQVSAIKVNSDRFREILTRAEPAEIREFSF
ncbi:MAG TPA: hypothetical protein V6C46_10415 [Coleofasciculaceae cyanobacterium]